MLVNKLVPAPSYWAPSSVLEFLDKAYDYDTFTNWASVLCRESGRAEKTSLENQLRKSERELMLMKTAITKEQEYKDAMSRRHHEILTEQRNLITRYKC